MIRSGKNIAIGILVLSLVGMLIFTFCDNPVKTENNVADLIKLDEKPSEQYVDKTGKQHTTKEIIYLTDEKAALLYRRERDSLMKLLDVKDKQIVGLTTFSGTATHSFTPNINIIEDSLRKVIGHEIAYTSKWFDLSGNTLEPSSFKAVQRDSVNLAFIKKPYGFLKLREKIMADAFSGNEEMVYTNIKSWSVPEARNNKAKIGFGATVGPGVQLSRDKVVTWGLQGTVGLQFRF